MTELNNERLQSMLDAEIPLGMSIADARSLITELLSLRQSHSTGVVEADDIASFADTVRHIEDGDFYTDYDRATAALDPMRRILSALAPVHKDVEPKAWEEPPLTCPHIDAAISSGELSPKVVAELEEIRSINSQLRYGIWHLKATPAKHPPKEAEVTVTEEMVTLPREGQREAFIPWVRAWVRKRFGVWITHNTAKGAFAEYQESARLLLKEGGE